MEQGFPVLVGDANGADKAVQKYLQSRGYKAVEVFCSGGECRNNLGKWPIRAVATSQTRKNFEYYSAKDEEMAQEASVGFMIWDGKSAGTLANAARLLRQGKKVVIYFTPEKRFLTLRAEDDWERLVSNCGREVREKALRSASVVWRQLPEKQASLL
jgi:adenine-specific DNA-methyltransferase